MRPASTLVGVLVQVTDPGPCTLHKRRNVRDHLPKDQQAWVDRKLAAAFNHDDPAKGERAGRDLAA